VIADLREKPKRRTVRLSLRDLRVRVGLRHFVAVSVLGMSACLGVFAQDDACLHRKMPITVIDRSSAPVGGIAVSDFRGDLRGKQVQILSLQRDMQSRQVVILLDVSGSMLQTEKDQWMLALQVAGDAVANLPPEIHLAFVTFDEKIVDTIDFTKGRGAIANRIVALTKGAKAIPSKSRRTALLDSLRRVLSVVGPLHPGDVVYLITDGGDNLSRTSATEVETAFLTSQVRLFVFLLMEQSALGYPVSRGRETPLSFRELVESTGGGLVSVSAGGEIGRRSFHLSEDEKAGVAVTLRHLYDVMKQFSWLEIGLPEAVNKPREWNLTLQHSSDATRKELRLLYPRKLLPCLTLTEAK